MKKMSKEELARLQAAGVDIKPKHKPVKKTAAPKAVKAPVPKKDPFPKFNKVESSGEMKAAVAAAQRAAEAAEKAATNTGYIATNIVEVITQNQVVKLKINRREDDLMDEIDLIRANT